MLGTPRQKQAPATPDRREGGTDEGVALDRGHLARQCMGDKDLEDEVLQEFRKQAATLIEVLTQGSHLSFVAKADIAHRLRGSALAIGAFPVAHAAAAVENSGRAGAPGEGLEQAAELSQAIVDLSEAVSQAAAEIDRLHRFP
jgi:HPt (histidine-containing phosphotransfer) domain-containing protein